MKNNVVVTGFLGYIGFNLTVTLLRLGYNVIGVDRKAENGEVQRFFDETGFQQNGRFDCFKANLSNFDEARDFIRWCKQQKLKAYTLINLSAETSIPQSLQHPDRVVGNNVLCTYASVMIAHALQCVKFIQACSITQIDCENNYNPYSYSKRLSSDVIAHAEIFDNVFYKSIMITNPFGSLAGVNRNGNAFETSLHNCITNGDVLQLSVEKDGVYDNVFKRNFISMYELITIFLYAVTQPSAGRSWPCSDNCILGGVPKPDDTFATYSITELVDYFSQYHDMRIQYVNSKDFTRIKTVPCLFPVRDKEFEKFVNSIHDLSPVLFQPPMYFNDKQRQTLHDLYDLIKNNFSNLYCQNTRFDILYKTFILSQEAKNKCCIS